jgi:hypothetical protein
MEWQGLEHVLKSLTLSSILMAPTKRPSFGLQRDHVLDNCPLKLCVKRFHSQQLAGPIDSEQHTLTNLIGLSLYIAVKIKGINLTTIPFEYLLNY